MGQAVFANVIGMLELAVAVGALAVVELHHDLSSVGGMATREIYLASDHAGFGLRTQLADLLREWGHIVHDLGPETDDRVDYPDFASKLALAMKPHSAKGADEALGVLVCGSGIGISMMANRYPWIRAAVCHDVTAARLSRLHNDANVIAFGERLVGAAVAADALEAFLGTGFEGGRHAARVEKLGEPASG